MGIARGSFASLLAVAALALTTLAAGPVVAAADAASAASPSRVEDLRDLSLDQLGAVQVTSVSKSPEALSDAPAAIYVISHEDILRSGATTVPEILRLAPNLQVARTSASHYVITARGFSGNSNAQNFSDKLLVLVDGRSVYSPLFSGVYWDMQDIPPDNIDRIEVISGPGATLWGANAVNGVINIITRRADQTQGLLLVVNGGDRGRSVTAQFGGQVRDGLSWRAYVRDLAEDDSSPASHDGWSKPQAGFRVDWAPGGPDAVTVQGDAYRGADGQAGAPDEIIKGANLLARWTHKTPDGAQLQVQTYYDHAGRETGGGGGRFAIDTWDLDVQHAFSLGTRHDVVMGGGVRTSRYRIDGSASLQFSPDSRTLNLVNLFAQDTIALTPATHLTLGLKLEDDPYSGVSALPSARLSWKASPSVQLWTAASRAIRSPTPFDRDVREFLGSTLFLKGGPDFRPEKLTAYEAGARLQPSERFSLSVAAFYNVYDDLKSIEPTPVAFLPLLWGNGMKGETSGVEVWGDWRAASWWRLGASASTLSEHISFRPGSAGLLGTSQQGDDPRYRATLRSSMNLGPKVTFDADLRRVGALPDPMVPAYTEMNARLTWTVTDHLQLSIAGANLLHERHMEFPSSEAVPRRVFAELRWRF